MRFVGAEGLDNIPKCLARARDLTFAESVARRATGGLADVVLNSLNADDAIGIPRSSCRHEAGAGHEQRSKAIRVSLLIDEVGIRVIKRGDDRIDRGYVTGTSGDGWSRGRAAVRLCRGL